MNKKLEQLCTYILYPIDIVHGTMFGGKKINDYH